MSGFIVSKYQKHSEFKNVPEGTHVGVIIGVAALGLQPGSVMYPAPRNLVAITVAFPGQKNDEGQDLEITTKYTLSLSKKATFRKTVEAICGPFKSEDAAKSFDAGSLIGKPALFSVVHKHKEDRTFANISGVIALPAGMPVSPTTSALRLFHPGLEPQAFLAAYNALPEFLRRQWDERIPDENAAGGDESEDVAV